MGVGSGVGSGVGETVGSGVGGVVGAGVNIALGVAGGVASDSVVGFAVAGTTDGSAVTVGRTVLLSDSSAEVLIVIVTIRATKTKISKQMRAFFIFIPPCKGTVLFLYYETPNSQS
jgi:hypothetical protein